MSVRKETLGFDVIVAGGGLSGMCAAIAAARHGAKTALVQNRSMFGGNASSEIRMHIVGANCHSSKADLRETGIIEEILLENKRRNPYASFPVFDTIMWEKIHLQENLTSFLNTNVDDVIMDGKNIRGIICHQNSTETEYTLYASVFIDATGHGTLGVMGGAVSRVGSESRYKFNEPTAPEKANDDTMGNSLMFIAVDRGEPVPFVKPEWAYSFSEDDLKYRPHVTGTSCHEDGGKIVAMEVGTNKLPGFASVDSGYWWIELGGQYDDIIRDGEKIRDELMRCVYGVWDHLKNVGDHGLQNYDLDWVGIIPGYRESRRLMGDYILTENDIRANRIFDDAVAYGGWPMDIHVRNGILDFDQYPSHVYNFEGCYTIPYRCYCSKNIDNLLMAGRDISTSKMAFSSTRVMGTCAIGGQASGTAAALSVRFHCTPRTVGQEHLEELQQLLLKDDCFIPGFSNKDKADLARSASVSADSEEKNGPAKNVINGISRSFRGKSNAWISEPLTKKGAVLSLALKKSSAVKEVRLTFDTDLSHEIMPSITKLVRDRQVKGLPHELVKDYKVTLYRKNKIAAEREIKDNGQRLNVLKFDSVVCDEVRITVLGTHGCKNARIFEVRVY